MVEICNLCSGDSVTIISVCPALVRALLYLHLLDWLAAPWPRLLLDKAPSNRMVSESDFSRVFFWHHYSTEWLHTLEIHHP
jgi:hypothetical protein